MRDENGEIFDEIFIDTVTHLECRLFHLMRSFYCDDHELTTSI